MLPSVTRGFGTALSNGAESRRSDSPSVAYVPRCRDEDSPRAVRCVVSCVVSCGTLQDMKLPIVGVRQIKLPVSDLARSARWYSDLFGLELAAEFYENSAVRGVVLADHAAAS